MSIEVTAKVDRDNAVYMTGESLAVTVVLKNTDEKAGSSLAWGCVQLHCDQVAHRSAKGVEAVQKAPQATTAVSRAKESIFSSTPSIVFCDLKLKPGDVQQFESQQHLPKHLPPSFKGHFTRYQWYVTVAVQHVDDPIRMLQLPIKVINVTLDLELPEEPKENPPSIVDVASSRVGEVTSVRSSKVYEIKNRDEVFATLTMFRNLFKLGDDVIGNIRFCHDKATCLQLLVRVETIELNLASDKKEEHVYQHFTEHYVTPFHHECHFKVPLPLNAVPSFATDAVQLKWRLHFEFVTTASENLTKSKKDVTQIATDVSIETMSWDHYIFVHSCSPYNVALICNVPSSTALLV